MATQRIVLDIETQRDFFDPDGACFGPSSPAVAGQIVRLFNWVRAERIPVVSTLLRLGRGELGPMGAHPHCIDGTLGEQKLPRTILPNRINFGIRSITDLPHELFDRYQQLVFEKRDTDIFEHARIERLITELEPTTFVVCGAGVGQGIVEAVVGLRVRRFEVIVVADAILDTEAPNQYLPYERMKAKGAVFAPVSQIIVPTFRSANTGERTRPPTRGVNHGAA